MTAWDRIQRLETELADARARIRGLETLLDDTRRTLEVTLAERESARSTAVRLEQEVAECQSDIHSLIGALAGLE